MTEKEREVNGYLALPYKCYILLIDRSDVCANSEIPVIVF